MTKSKRHTQSHPIRTFPHSAPFHQRQKKSAVPRVAPVLSLAYGKETPSHDKYPLERIPLHYAIMRHFILNTLQHSSGFTHVTEYAMDTLMDVIPRLIQHLGEMMRRNASLARRTDANVLDLVDVLEKVDTQDADRGIGLQQLMVQLQREIEAPVSQDDDSSQNSATLPSDDDVYLTDALYQNLSHQTSHLIDPSHSQHRHAEIPYLPAFPEMHTYRVTEHLPPKRNFNETTLRKEAQEIEGSLTDIYMAQTSLKSMHFEDQYDMGNQEGGITVDGASITGDLGARKSHTSAGIISSRPIVNPYMPSTLKNPVKVRLADIASQNFNINESVVKLIPPLIRLHEPVEHMSRWKLPRKWNEYQTRCDPSMRNVQHILRFQNPQMK